MYIRYFGQCEDENLLRQMRRLIYDCDNEFIPPISKREISIADYCYKVLMTQQLIVAMIGDKVVGFLSYLWDEEKDWYYINTIITDPEYRGRGVATNLYGRLVELCFDHDVTIRTWSTNEKQISILKKFNFEEYNRIRNDRGEGIDSIYYILHVT